MYKERGATPRQALTADIIAEFEIHSGCRCRSDPKAKELEAQVKQATENIATFGGTALNIVWNPQAKGRCRQKALPEALEKGEKISPGRMQISAERKIRRFPRQ
ncbi:MAG: hypothetical protein R3D26_14855 [Cyanobacteriota/Melainabacteria group bacterium]